MKNKYTAEEVLKIIEEMKHEEKIKLLVELGYRHFGNERLSPEEVRQLNYEAMYGDDED